MGIDINGLRFLLYAQAAGADFAHTAMIGRQQLLFGPQDVTDNFQAFGQTVRDNVANDIVFSNNRYAEPLFEQLGAQQVHSFDNSEYESATHIHDMNAPISAEMHQQYSVVLDGGSLEHVFNVPTAFKNCMEMVAVGGHYLGITPANNYMGHGFYQFSPELHFRVFTPENGFELIDVIAFETGTNATWYRVNDPQVINRRVRLINDHPVLLFVLAKRIAVRPIFATTPQQSDYVTLWDQPGAAPAKANGQGGNRPKATPRPSLLKYAKANAPVSVKRVGQRVTSLFDNNFPSHSFQPFDPTAGQVRSAAAAPPTLTVPPTPTVPPAQAVPPTPAAPPTAPTDAVAKIESLDTSLFKHVHTESSDAERRDFLALQRAIRKRADGYVYLEIGSHVGGSIQPHLVDPACRKIYSIDKRPLMVPDERGRMFPYPENSTQRMLDLLAEIDADAIDKIVCFDQDASEVDKTQIVPPPHLCFIDGEHTVEAVLSDFDFCLSVCDPNGVIVFHDSSILNEGVRKILKRLRKNRVQFEGLKLADGIYVICFGKAADWYAPQLRDRTINETVFFMRARFWLMRKRFWNRPIVKQLAQQYRQLGK